MADRDDLIGLGEGALFSQGEDGPRGYPYPVEYSFAIATYISTVLEESLVGHGLTMAWQERAWFGNAELCRHRRA